MRITSAKFIKSLTKDYAEFNSDLPEVALVGKSNVGKSSLINMLTNQNKLAKVSKTPGKTKLVNYFLLNGNFYLVDLPGYGFANVSKEELGQWDARMGGYFEQSPMLKVLLILIDIRREPTEHDIAMIEYANYFGIPYIVMATKADKVAKSKRKNECNRIKRLLKDYHCETVLHISSEDKLGKDELLEVIEGYLFAEEEEA